MYEPSLLSGSVHVPVALISYFMLAQASRDARLAGLFLLLSSKKRTNPLGPISILSVERHLYHLIADVDAGFRAQALSLFRKLIDRLKNSIASGASSAGSEVQHAWSRNLSQMRLQDKAQNSASVGQIKLLAHLQRTLLWQMHPCSSYQRHITALRALQDLLESEVESRIDLTDQAKLVSSTQLRWPFNLSVYTLTLKRLLLDLLLDPFDDVRSFAASSFASYKGSVHTTTRSLTTLLRGANGVLRFAATSPSVASSDTELLQQVITSAQQRVIQTGRADHADGLARAYGALSTRTISHLNNVLKTLVKTLDVALETAATNITAAVETQPLHAYFKSLWYVVCVIAGISN